MYNEIFKIEEFIWSKIEEERRIGLLNGLSGVGLFYKFMVDYDSQEYSPKLANIVEKIESIISEEETLPSICSGLAGYGILLINLTNIVSIDDSYLSDMDDILLDFLKSQSNILDYDFLHGSLGIGQYFIERHKSVQSEHSKAIVSDYYNTLLKNVQINFENVIKQVEHDGSETIYFGLAHGIAGLINALFISNKYVQFEKKYFNSSLHKLLNFLTKYELKNETFLYPNFFSTIDNQIIKSRMAWCQGDLGIGNSLINIATINEDEILSRKGKHLISRTFDFDLNKGDISDVGICHGISGVLLQYWLYYDKFKNSDKTNILVWKEYLKNHTKNYSEFKAFHKGLYVDEINLLEGAAGIALTNLTIENKIDRNWISYFNLA